MKSRRTCKADETPEFQAFWDIWKPMARHTDGRAMARDAFFNHVANGADPQDIVDGARYFSRGVKDKQFVPLSATWLNRGAYEDLCDQEREFQATQADRQQRQENVVAMRRVLPKNHFQNQWPKLKQE